VWSYCAFGLFVAAIFSLDFYVLSKKASLSLTTRR
jgi:hypothetical protein